ncbi:MAG: cytochrome o ubiquinol oxidase subunit III [Corticimicrobacter sp.]|uniref:cytochrome o ubiquinol oxidase subunit III n=1 Tax=Corticimicrobacter sp. TaxID=2678536 RepID=UPI0032DB764E
MSSQTLHHSAATPASGQEHGHDHEHHDSGSTSVFGFWIYLMSDCVLFGSIFAVFAVLSNAFAGGPTSAELFGQQLPFVLTETFVLLFSSITYGFAMLAMHRGDRSGVLKWLCVTFLLGATFISMELYEFHHLIENGNGPSRSAYLSAFFTLVGTHGAHVFSGLIWMAVMIHQVSSRGLTASNQTRLNCLSIFWHFLDVVWICVFTVVYLMGVL